ncbi:MAG: hemerythrin family protein [Dorea sp.]|jgi:hemerythrin|nr:hemerythrin family protein [Dorea sp.]
MRIEFDENLITGNEMIDTQHKELIDRTNQFLAKLEENVGRVDAIKMLDYLDEYVEFHFGEEEKLQEEIGYPGLAEHKERHKELQNTVKELYDMLEEEEGPSEAFVKQVEVNVVDWLVRHIQGFDRSVAEYRFMADNAEKI